jgi:hypothetical protein
MRVFSSYHRQDGHQAAGWSRDWLGERFILMMDVDRIQPDLDVTAGACVEVNQTDVLPATGGQHDVYARFGEIVASLGLDDELCAILVAPAGCLTNPLLHEITLRLGVRRRCTVILRDSRLLSRHVRSWLNR